MSGGQAGTSGQGAKFSGRKCGTDTGGAIGESNRVPAEEGARQREEVLGEPSAVEVNADDGMARDAGTGSKPEYDLVVGEVMEEEGTDDDIETRVGEGEREGIGDNLGMGSVGEVSREAVERDGAVAEALLDGTGSPAVARGDIQDGVRVGQACELGVENALPAKPAIDEFEFGENPESGFVWRVVEDLRFDNARHRSSLAGNG